MYSFIKNQWILGNITSDKVYSYVPRYITQEQAEEIVNTPQTGTLSVKTEEM